MITSPQSRYRNAPAYQDAEGRWYLAPRRRMLFRDLPDTRMHPVTAGDTLWGLADRYFQPLEDAALLYWAIGDFQPTPIADATLALEAGTRLYVPSVRAVREHLATNGRRAGTR